MVELEEKQKCFQNKGEEITREVTQLKLNEDKEKNLNIKNKNLETEENILKEMDVHEQEEEIKDTNKNYPVESKSTKIATIKRLSSKLRRHRNALLKPTACVTSSVRAKEDISTNSRPHASFEIAQVSAQIARETTLRRTSRSSPSRQSSCDISKLSSNISLSNILEADEKSLFDLKSSHEKVLDNGENEKEKNVFYDNSVCVNSNLSQLPSDKNEKDNKQHNKSVMNTKNGKEDATIDSYQVPHHKQVNEKNSKDLIEIQGGEKKKIDLPPLIFRTTDKIGNKIENGKITNKNKGEDKEQQNDIVEGKPGEQKNETLHSNREINKNDDGKTASCSNIEVQTSRRNSDMKKKGDQEQNDKVFNLPLYSKNDKKNSTKMSHYKFFEKKNQSLLPPDKLKNNINGIDIYDGELVNTRRNTFRNTAYFNKSVFQNAVTNLSLSTSPRFPLQLLQKFTEEEIQAAHKIQAVWRGYCVRVWIHAAKATRIMMDKFDEKKVIK